MAYRIKNFENMSVGQVDEIFRRGRGLQFDQGEHVDTGVPTEDLHLGNVPMPPAVVVDEDLELCND